MAEHPKTTKETLGRALDYIEVQRFYHPAIVAQKKWENEASLIQKVFDIIISSQALTLASNAAKTYHSLYIKQQFLLNLYQKERN